MNILILNWKDSKHPQAGGAEILTEKMAKGFIKRGHQVTLFVSTFPGASKKEIIDGITIIRSGQLDLRALQESVHYKAYRYYKDHLQEKVDVVIDEVHGMPFFTKFYIKEKKIAFICEVADDIWFRMFSFPWNMFGWLLERIYLLLYRNIPIMTISPSSKKELIRCFIPQKNITVLPMGITKVSIDKTRKEKKPTLIFVGRLNKMKGIEDAIRAFAFAKRKIPQLQLWIVGRGENRFVKSLKNLSTKLGVSPVFYDYVSERKKFELMSHAHAIVVPSVREGFGLIVPEAGSVGTPAIVYNVHGLRDTVINGVNGIKVSASPSSLAKGIEKLFMDKQHYRKMCLAANQESLRYNWDATAEEAIKILRK